MKRPGGFDGGGFDDNPPEKSEPKPQPKTRSKPRPKARPKSEPKADAKRRPKAKDRSKTETSSDADITGQSSQNSVDTNVEGQPERVADEATDSSVIELSEFAAQRPRRGVLRRSQAEPPAEDRVRNAERALTQARSSVRKRDRRETKRFTAHLRRRRRNWFVVGGAVLALAAFVAIGTLSPLMAVQEVQISGASRVSTEKLETALSRFEGEPLTLVSEREVHRALEPFSLIQRYSIERIPPHTLLIRIEERDPVIAVGKKGKYKLLDPAGVLVTTAEKIPKGVPLGEGPAANPGTPAFEAAGSVVRDLPQDIRDRLVGVKASSAQDVELILKNGTTVIWGESADTQEKAVVLRAMLKAVGGVSSIDVSAPEAPVFE